MTQKRCISPNNPGEVEAMVIKKIPVGGAKKVHIRPKCHMRDKDGGAKLRENTKSKQNIAPGRARKERYT